MSEVARPGTADIDALLDALLAEWRDAAELAQEPSGLEPADRELFLLERTLTEERLARLNGYVRRDLPTPAQRDRLEQLQQLIAQYRPLLDKLPLIDV